MHIREETRYDQGCVPPEELKLKVAPNTRNFDRAGTPHLHIDFRWVAVAIEHGQNGRAVWSTLGHVLRGLEVVAEHGVPSR